MMRFVVAAISVAVLALSNPTWAAIAPSAAADATVDYQVKPRDTLEGIARRYLLSRSDIALLRRINGVRNPRRLPVGMVLRAPLARLRRESMELTVVAFAGKVAAGGSSTFAPVRSGTHVREGEIIETGPNSFVTLAYGDGSLMTLPSLTRARIEDLHRLLLNDSIERRVLIERGRGEYQVTPLRAPRDRFEVRTPMAVAAVRGTEFRVNFDPGRETSALEVLEGRVGERAAASEDTAVVTGGAAAVRAPGIEGRLLVPLPAAPDLERPGRVQDEADVAFAIASPKGGYDYRVQLSRDAGFTDLFAETMADHGQASFAGVANGTFFVRVTAIEGHGVEGLPTTYAFERSFTSLTGDVKGPAAKSRHRLYAFKWRAEGEGSLTFQFILARDPDLHDRLADEVGLTANEVDLVDLRPGIYYWRVVMNQMIGGKLHLRALKVNTLRIASDR